MDGRVGDMIPVIFGTAGGPKGGRFKSSMNIEKKCVWYVAS